MSYATDADVLPLLGDLELPSTLSITTYVNRASDEIDLALGVRYVVPLTPSDYFTQRLLSVANAELAAAHIFLSQASGGEDNSINSYGKHLWGRAMERLKPYLEGVLTLPGTVLRPDSSIDEGAGPVGIYHEDLVSPVAEFYKFVQGRGVVF